MVSGMFPGSDATQGTRQLEPSNPEGLQRIKPLWVKVLVVNGPFEHCSSLCTGQTMRY